MIDRDALAQFMANQRSISTTSTSIVTPTGIVTVTVEFEPFEDDDD